MLAHDAALVHSTTAQTSLPRVVARLVHDDAAGTGRTDAKD